LLDDATIASNLVDASIDRRRYAGGVERRLSTDPITDAPLTDAHADELAHTLHALADRTRVLIVSAILHAPDGELHGRDLQAALGLRQPTASHHLRKLVRAGILTREQRGPYGFYRVVPEALGDICRALGGSAPAS
jgi:ArsR family transcriptional regulator, arsenate/arsenite/antimonite-responsive transcriptional repressor